MQNRRFFSLCVGLFAFAVWGVGQTLTPDSCRALALRHNKELQAAREGVTAARYERKAAFTNFLPKVSATGAYLYTNRELSLLSHGQKQSLATMGDRVQGGLQTALTELAADNPLLAPLLEPLAGVDVAAPINEVGQSLTEALRTDTRNVWAGAVTLTQPLYMGGKVDAYYRIMRYAEQLEGRQLEAKRQETVLQTDEAYWQIVSLSHKRRLAESYLQLTRALESDVQKMIAAGVATEVDGLSVTVKVNEAELSLTEADNGLTISRMLLCQLCGLPLDTPVRLADEEAETIDLASPTVGDTVGNVMTALALRPELQSLELLSRIRRQEVRTTRAEFLPTLALTGGYLTSNPSLFNGFERKFSGTWFVGLSLQVPVWNWGESLYKVRAARARVLSADCELDAARELVTLQVRRSEQEVQEARRRCLLTRHNVDKAGENLRYARLGFREGVIPTSGVLEAQTAWLSARSAAIDAQISLRLAEVALKKALGEEIAIK